ncbi:transposase [Streptomyces sp. NPDC005227]|uniref:transposase n=1 Tax=unclassified Streptomyces TaxID=2593676 RepID=UPI0036CA25CD
MYALLVRWERAQYVDDLHDMLRDRLRHRDGRDREPSAAIVDSQSVRAAETVGADSRGWDAGKKVNGRKRHIAVDTLGLLLVVLVTTASVQDRDGARPLISRLRQLHPQITWMWADGGYAGKLVTWAKGDGTSPSRSYDAATTPKASSSCPAVGRSNAVCPGSVADDAASVTTNASPPITKPWPSGQ